VIAEVRKEIMNHVGAVIEQNVENMTND